MTEASAVAPAWLAEGRPDGPPVVFVHGTQLSRVAWRPQVERLADRYRCITLDLPGHGTLAGRPFVLDSAAAVVEGAIDAEAGGRALVVGLSLGGYVAMTVATRDPRRVRGLVLAGCTTEPVGLAALVIRAAAFGLDHVPRGLLRAATRTYFRRIHGDPVAGPLLRSAISPGAGAEALRALVGVPFHDRLLSYGGPVQVVNGDLDVFFRAGERRFLAGLPNVRRRILARTTHLSNLDRPDEFSAIVAAFEQSLPA